MPRAPTAFSRRSARSIRTADAAIVINVQGDLPTLAPADITAALALLADQAVDIGTVAAEITRAEERDDPSVVKVVGSRLGRRACAPSISPAPPRPYGEGPLYHHIGLYAFRRPALERFVKLPPSPLEKREKLEQLRALEAGMRIDVAIVDYGAARRRHAGGFGARARHAIGTVMKRRKKIAFQGEAGANSHIACIQAYPSYEPLPCPTFEDAFAAVRTGRADSGDDPDRQFGGRAGRRHPPPDAEVRAAHRRASGFCRSSTSSWRRSARA